jgi:hypothetical protein
MKSRFILFKRAGVYYSEDTVTRKQHSLRTKDEAEALTILHSKNEAHRQPVLNLQIARTYLTATDPEMARRTWQTAMDELTKTKTGSVVLLCMAYDSSHETMATIAPTVTNTSSDKSTWLIAGGRPGNRAGILQPAFPAERHAGAHGTI